MLLPCEDNYLRNIVPERRSMRISRFDKLPFDHESGILRILESELGLLRKISILRDELEMRYDYSISGCFRAIDRYNVGRLDAQILKDFFR